MNCIVNCCFRGGFVWDPSAKVSFKVGSVDMIEPRKHRFPQFLFSTFVFLSFPSTSPVTNEGRKEGKLKEKWGDEEKKEEEEKVEKWREKE